MLLARRYRHLRNVVDRRGPCACGNRADEQQTETQLERGRTHFVISLLIERRLGAARSCTFYKPAFTRAALREDNTGKPQKRVPALPYVSWLATNVGEISHGHNGRTFGF